MNLYKISQDINDGYDTYSDAVVCAENEDDARLIHPSEFVTHFKNSKWYGTHTDGTEYETENWAHSWVLFNELDKVKVEYIGIAQEDLKRGVICSSFHAG